MVPKWLLALSYKAAPLPTMPASWHAKKVCNGVWRSVLGSEGLDLAAFTPTLSVLVSMVSSHHRQGRDWDHLRSTEALCLRCMPKELIGTATLWMPKAQLCADCIWSFIIISLCVSGVHDFWAWQFHPKPNSSQNPLFVRLCASVGRNQCVRKKWAVASSSQEVSCLVSMRVGLYFLIWVYLQLTLRYSDQIDRGTGCVIGPDQHNTTPKRYLHVPPSS